MKCLTATLVLAISLFADQLQAQSLKVSGNVKDEKEPLAFVTVSLLKAIDSSWVQSELTNEEGDFTFDKVIKDDYLLDVKAIGYEHYIQPLGQYENILVQLVRGSNQLNEIVVKSTLPKIQSSAGKTTVNFEQTTIAAGSNVLELLRKTPGVVVDGNGNVSMNGKGILIIVDGKQTYLSGDDLVNYLKSLPAEQVAQFDLMSQPSAKYDAEGGTGIIDIKTRRSKRKGLNGNVAASYGQGKYPNTHNSANISYVKDDLNINVNAGYLHATGYRKAEERRLARDMNTGDVTSAIKEHVFQKETFEDYNLKIGAGYKINDKINIGGSIKGIYHPNHQRDVSGGTIQDFVNNTVAYNNSNNDRGFRRYNLNSNINLAYTLAKDHEITGDFDNLKLSQKDGQQLVSNNYDEQLQLLPTGLQLNSNFPLEINVRVGKVDYSGTIKKVRLESGIKASVLNTQAGSFYTLQQGGVWINDTSRSNNYLYRENINAAYVNTTAELSEKWQAQAGLRLENTNINGLQEITGQRFDRSFTSAFPTVFVSYKIDDKNTFEANGGRRLERPSYRALNPFAFYTSQYKSQGGNPDLLPEFRYYAELKHNYNNKLFTSFGVAKVWNCINRVLVYDAVTKAVKETEQNNCNKRNAHLSISYSDQVAEWWTLSASYDWYHNQYEDYNGNSLAISDGHSVGISNQFILNGGWGIDTVYVFNSGDLQNLTERNGQNQWIGASVTKKIMKDTATVKLSIDDPFNIYRYTPRGSWNGVETTSVSEFATQGVSVGFTYNFGKKQDVQQHNSNIEESKRM